MTRKITKPSSTDHDRNDTVQDTDTTQGRTSFREQGSESERDRDGGRGERERGHDLGESLHRGEFSERSDRPARDERLDQASRPESGPERIGARRNGPDAGSIPELDVTKMFTSMFELGAGMLRIQQQMFASLLGATTPNGMDASDQNTGGRETKARNTSSHERDSRNSDSRNSDSRNSDSRNSDGRDSGGRDTRGREGRTSQPRSIGTPAAN